MDSAQILACSTQNSFDKLVHILIGSLVLKKCFQTQEVHPRKLVVQISQDELSGKLFPQIFFCSDGRELTGNYYAS